MENKRSSNFELLRILAMLMIVFHHFSFFGGYVFDRIALNTVWAELLLVGGKIAVNIYILISGYFLIDSQGVSVKKVLKLAGQILFYSLVIDVLAIAVGVEGFSVKGLVKGCFPITYERWWFAGAYFVLYLLSPYINLFLRKLDKQTYRKLLVTLFILWSVIPSVFGPLYQSNNLLWFVSLYAAAAYVRLHGVGERPAAFWLGIGAGIALLAFAAVLLLDILGLRYAGLSGQAMYVFAMQRLPAAACAWFAFLGFRAMDLGCCRAVNVVASASFGVYLIHEHPVIRRLLWGELFPGETLGGTAYFPVYSVLVVLGIFVLCTMIDLVRMYTVEKVWMMLAGKMEAACRSVCARICSRKEKGCVER